MVPLLIIFGIILICCIVWYYNRPKVSVNNTPLPKEQSQADGNGSDIFFQKVMNGEDIGYWDGPKPTAQQEEENLKGIVDHIEKFPNGVLAKKNPEYLEEYLKRIDLDLPPGIKTEESKPE